MWMIDPVRALLFREIYNKIEHRGLEDRRRWLEGICITSWTRCLGGIWTRLTT